MAKCTGDGRRVKVKLFLATLVVASLALSGHSSAYANPDEAIFISGLVWRGDGEGDYAFKGNGKLRGAKIAQDGAVTAISSTGTYELTSSYDTKGPIYSISANWAFTGEVTLEMSATGVSKDYIPIINGVPLDLNKLPKSRLSNLGNSIKWKARLTAGSTLSEVRIVYNTTKGVVGSFGNPELSGFMFKKPVYIRGGATGLFHYQIPVRVGESARATGSDFYVKGVIQANFADVRFTQADGETLLPYWLEDITGTVPDRTATFWVKIPHIPQDGMLLSMYYGNREAVDFSDGEAVFDFFDDFRSNVLDSKKWKTTLTSPLSGATLSYDGLEINASIVTSAAYVFKDGIIEYKAKSTQGDAIIGIIRQGESGNTGRIMAYSSQNADSEHSIVVGDDVKANEENSIILGKYYNYAITANGKNLTFRRYSADKSKLEAEVEYNDTASLTEGAIGLTTSSQGAGVYFDRIFVRQLAYSQAAIDTAKTDAEKEEIPNLAHFKGLEIAPNGNVTLKKGKTEGRYTSPLIHSPFKARIVVPSWKMETGEITVDISAKEYGLYKEGCKNASFYYAARKDFAQGEALRWRAKFIRSSDEGRNPNLKLFTMDFRPGGIKLIAPNGGEYAIIGERYTVKWDAADYGPGYKMKLEYSTDGGMKYSTIAALASNTGIYNWTVPDETSAKAVARISDPFAAGVYDASDNYFSIVTSLRGVEDAEAISEEEATEEAAVEVTEAEPPAPRPIAGLYDLLIKVGDNPREGGYKEGDIVNIKPAGFLWGREEKNAEKFLIIQSYLTEEESVDLMKPKLVNGKRVNRRKYKIDLKGKDIIEAEREVEIGAFKAKEKGE